jgi:DNA-binding MarR family transcriptional regulator
MRRLREQAPGADLTKSQSSVLARLERGGAATATALANAEGMRPQSMAKIIRALEDAGLVSGSPDPNDGRKTLLDLTEVAREEYRTGRRIRQDWLAQAMEASLSPEEIIHLAKATDLLRRLTKAT